MVASQTWVIIQLRNRLPLTHMEFLKLFECINYSHKCFKEPCHGYMRDGCTIMTHEKNASSIYCTYSFIL